MHFFKSIPFIVNDAVTSQFYAPQANYQKLGLLEFQHKNNLTQTAFAEKQRSIFQIYKEFFGKQSNIIYGISNNIKCCNSTWCVKT